MALLVDSCVSSRVLVSFFSLIFYLVWATLWKLYPLTPLFDHVLSFRDVTHFCELPISLEYLNSHCDSQVKINVHVGI